MDYSNWLTPYNVGQTYGHGGESDPWYSNDYEALFTAGDIYNTARDRFGYTGAMPVPQGGEDQPQQFGNPQQELLDWMKSSGYTYALNPTRDGGQLNAWLDASGKPIDGTLQEFQGGDKNFGIASSLLGAALGGIGMSHAGLLGGAAGAAPEGLSLAGEYGGAGALGDASLLTGSSLGTVAQPAAGMTYGGSALGGGLSAANAGLTGGGSPSYLTEGALTPMEVPSQAWQNPALASTQSPTATLAASAAAPSFIDKLPGLLTNPKVIGAVAGGLLGGTGADSSEPAPYTGSMPTIERGNWKPNAQANLMQVPQFGQGLLSGPGVANSGLWRFKG